MLTPPSSPTARWPRVAIYATAIQASPWGGPAAPRPESTQPMPFRWNPPRFCVSRPSARESPRPWFCRRPTGSRSAARPTTEIQTRLPRRLSQAVHQVVGQHLHCARLRVARAPRKAPTSSNRSSTSRTGGRRTVIAPELNLSVRALPYPLRYPLGSPGTEALRCDLARPPRDSVTSSSGVSCRASRILSRTIPPATPGPSRWTFHHLPP